MSEEPIRQLRWVERDGVTVLQFSRGGHVEDGEIVWDWADVKLEAL